MAGSQTSEYVQRIIDALMKPDPKEVSYYEALGRFIASYALAEAQIHTLARHYSGTNDAKARVIFAGFRLADSIDRLRALSKLPVAGGGLFSTYAKPEELETIESCLTQLALITDKRSKLVHRQISYGSDGFTVSDLSTARSLIHSKPDFITLDNLKDMDADCTIIYLRIAALMQREGDPKPLSPWLVRSWRYTPPKPPPQKAKPPGGRRERKRQRRASQRSQQEK